MFKTDLCLQIPHIISRGAYITSFTWMPTTGLILPNVSWWPIRPLIHIVMDVSGGWKQGPGFTSKIMNIQCAAWPKSPLETKKRTHIWAHLQSSCCWCSPSTPRWPGCQRAASSLLYCQVQWQSSVCLQLFFHQISRFRLWLLWFFLSCAQANTRKFLQDSLHQVHHMKMMTVLIHR